MALPIASPLRDILRSLFGDLRGQIGMAIATGVFALIALCLLASAGLVMLTRVTGYPLAALIFAAGFAVMAVLTALIGRAVAARRARKAAAATNRLMLGLALGKSLTGSTPPLVAVGAFLAAFALGRRL